MTVVLSAVAESLPALRDIPGVQGSFVVADGGAVAGRDLTSLVDDGTLAEIAPRLQRLHETLSAAGDYLETCTFAFAEYRLYVKRLPHGFLGTLLSPAANLPALRMAANLVARRIGGQLGELPARAPEPPALPPPGAGAASVPPPSAPDAPTQPDLPSTARAVPRAPEAGATARPSRIYRGTVQR